MGLSQLLPLSEASASSLQLPHLSLQQQKACSLQSGVEGRLRSLYSPSLKRQLRRRSRSNSQSSMAIAYQKQQRPQHVSHLLLPLLLLQQQKKQK
jgi:hypothetical protein